MEKWRELLGHFDVIGKSKKLALKSAISRQIPGCRFSTTTIERV